MDFARPSSHFRLQRRLRLQLQPHGGQLDRLGVPPRLRHVHPPGQLPHGLGRAQEGDDADDSAFRLGMAAIVAARSPGIGGRFRHYYVDSWSILDRWDFLQRNQVALMQGFVNFFCNSTVCWADAAAAQRNSLQNGLHFVYMYRCTYGIVFREMMKDTFFVGLAGGSFPLIATLYVTESVEADMRGTFGIFMNVMMTSGMLFVNGVGSLVHWVVLTGILVAFPCR